MAIFNTDISQGSVATPLRCGGNICTRVYYKFPTESNSERILKIGHYLAKLWARVWCLVFFDSRCIIEFSKSSRFLRADQLEMLAATSLKAAGSV